MYWLTRPPILRYLAAFLLVSFGLFLEVRPQPMDRHPFAAAALPPGATITEHDVEFRDVAAGLLPPISLPAVARVGIEAGDPLTTTLLARSGQVAPDGWWSLEISVPDLAVPGMDVLLVSPGSPGVIGVVVSVRPGDDFGGGPMGLVAIPPESAEAVATAFAENRLVPLLGR